MQLSSIAHLCVATDSADKMNVDLPPYLSNYLGCCYKLIYEYPSLGSDPPYTINELQPKKLMKALLTPALPAKDAGMSCAVIVSSFKEM